MPKKDERYAAFCGRDWLVIELLAKIHNTTPAGLLLKLIWKEARRWRLPAQRR